MHKPYPREPSQEKAREPKKACESKKAHKPCKVNKVH